MKKTFSTPANFYTLFSYRISMQADFGFKEVKSQLRQVENKSFWANGHSTAELVSDLLLH